MFADSEQDSDVKARERHDAKVKKEVELYYDEIKYHESMIRYLKTRGPPTKFTVPTDEQEELLEKRRKYEEELINNPASTRD